MSTLHTAIENNPRSDLSEGCGIKVTFSVHDYTALFSASMRGHVHRVEKLIRAGIDIDTTDISHRTPLYVAVNRDRRNVVAMLLSAGADANIACTRQFTPLYRACVHGHVEITRMLIQFSCNVDAPCFHNKRALHAASKHGCIDIVRQLVEARCDIHAVDDKQRTPLFVACEHTNTQCVKYLLQCGSRVNECDEDGNTPLHIASKTGCLRIIQELITHRCDLDIKNKQNRNALCMAYSHLELYEDIMATLINAGCDLNAKLDEIDVTILFLAADNRDLKLVRLLLQSGCDKNQCSTNESKTALHIAVERGNVLLVYLLHRHDCDWLQPDCNAETPLDVIAFSSESAELYHIQKHGRLSTEDLNPSNTHAMIAAAHNNVHRLEAELSNVENDVNKQNGDGETALFVAAYYGSMAALNTLLDHNCDVNIPDDMGKTPLYIAVERNHVKLIETLIRHRCDVNQPDKNGTVPLMLAVDAGNAYVTRLLVAAGANVNSISRVPNARIQRYLISAKVDDICTFVTKHADDPAQQHMGLLREVLKMENIQNYVFQKLFCVLPNAS